jgi:FixJ family two-component response regulator
MREGDLAGGQQSHPSHHIKVPLQRETRRGYDKPQTLIVTTANRLQDALDCTSYLHGSGLDFQAQLRALNISLPVILMTGHGDVPMSVKGMKAGAIDFLTKPIRDQDLLDAIATAVDRDRLRRELEREMADLRERYSQLSPREKEVMLLVTSGKMNKQAAGELHLSEITVKIHRGAAMRKMGARTLTDLVRMVEALKLNA